MSISLSGIADDTSYTLNITAPQPEIDAPSSSSELSSGAAAFILIALALACVAQPSGSLVLGGVDRFWRLHPFFSFGEATVVYFRCFHLLIIRRWPPRTIGYILLAERFGNSARYNLWWRMQEAVAAPTKDELEHVLRAVDDMERSVTFRAVVYVPVLLQFAKLLVIRGHIFLTVIGMMYFLSWLAIEILLLFVSGTTLDDDEVV